MKQSGLTILLSVFLSALAAWGIVRSTAASAATQPASSSVSSGSVTVNIPEDRYPDFTYAAETAVKAVVYVKVTMKAQQGQGYQMLDPFFQFFFGDPFGGQQQPRQQREQQASGSGVIIREDGYIVTNNHVVANASKVEVTLNDNTTYPAVIVGTDPATDVALLKVEAKDLPTVEFTDSDKVRLGEWVLAIGSPYDLRSTITAGIVSAKGRQMNYTGEYKIESFIQTDAAVNPGNSGGALVNKAGQLVGVNTAIVSQTGSYTGYSFAIPSNIVKKIVNDMIDFGSVKRALLGVRMGTVDDKIAKDLKLSSPEGVYIDEVTKGGAADKAGMKHGDVLVELGGQPVKDAPSLQERVNAFHPGDKTTAKIIRGGKTLTLDVTFQGTADENGSVESDGTVTFYGARLKAAPKEALQRIGQKSGVAIASLDAGKMLEAGAEEGFIILYVNSQKVSTPQDVLNIVKKQDADRAVLFEGVTAAGKTGWFAFQK